MNQQPFQDLYPESHAHCYGCGRLNPEGLHLKSYWHGEETVCYYTPDAKYTGGVPGFLYGGMIASLLDCHGAATASAAKAKEEGGSISRFVTASLQVNFLAPTPMGTELEIRGRVQRIAGRKVTVALQLLAAGTVCATGSVLMIQMREPHDCKVNEEV